MACQHTGELPDLTPDGGDSSRLNRPWWAPADDGPSDGDLDAFVRARMELAHVPGLSLAIIRDGKLLRATGFGFANLAEQRPMLADTLINIGSATKTTTYIPVMQLWERKRFALDDDVNAHLSFPVRNFAYPGVPVTLRQLLTHTSSIADGPAYEKSYACGDSQVPLGQWLHDYLTAGGGLYDPQRNFHPWKPGAQFEYSNIAYGLLGHLVEAISGMSYSDYMLSRVFAPLGMSHSRILLAGMDPQSHAALHLCEEGRCRRGRTVRRGVDPSCRSEWRRAGSASPVQLGDPLRMGWCEPLLLSCHACCGPS